MKTNSREKIVLERLKKLAQEIKKHNNYYHTLDKPKISDSEYDELIKENNELENKFPHLVLRNSPNKFVGSRIKFKFQKVEHLSQMFSLGNAFNSVDVFDFIKRTNKFLNMSENNNFKILCEPKIDGLSLNLFYKKGKLISAATRGDGFIGENVTDNIKNIKEIPYKLKHNFPDIIEIRGEVFLNKEIISEFFLLIKLLSP